MTSLTNVTVTFRLEGSHDILRLDKFSGELWLKRDISKVNVESFHGLVITAERSDGESARMTLDLHVLPVDDVKSFCEKFLCFYESVSFHVLEDYAGSFRAREVGEMSPRIYGRFCKMFDVEYEQLNGNVE